LGMGERRGESVGWQLVQRDALVYLVVL
jgi:hypothetical protein